jgi:SAM-dependent methyltransferase
MSIDDRFDLLVDSLAGFYRSWTVYLGLELGLFARIREAGAGGIDPDSLATVAGCSTPAVAAWAFAAVAYDLVSLDGDRLRIDEEAAVVLLDEQRREYLGGQIFHAVVASLDHDRLADVIRTGRPAAERPDRYRASIERLTLQDVAIFFEEALAQLPDLVVALDNGARLVDLHCGGGRWLIAIARRFPRTSLLGVEFQPDSVARARANVEAAGLTDRIAIEEADIPAIDKSVGMFDLAYFQYAIHQLDDPVAALRAGHRALRPGGRLLVLEWCAPSNVEDYRTLHGQLVAGIQLDELFSGTRLRTVEEFLELIGEANIGDPLVLDLPSGATIFEIRKPTG